jgi:hypothetical protein
MVERTILHHQDHNMFDAGFVWSGQLFISGSCESGTAPNGEASNDKGSIAEKTAPGDAGTASGRLKDSIHSASRANIKDDGIWSNVAAI